MKSRFFAALMLLFGLPAHAGGWSGPLTIDRIWTENSDMIAIYTTGAPVFTSGCSQNAYLFRATNDAQRARAYATLLTAIATGQRIELWYNDTCTTWSFHDVTSIMIHAPP
jgi:hypothetical protein